MAGWAEPCEGHGGSDPAVGVLCELRLREAVWEPQRARRAAWWLCTGGVLAAAPSRPGSPLGQKQLSCSKTVIPTCVLRVFKTGTAPRSAGALTSFPVTIK